MSQVNLLPPEIRQRIRTRRQAILIGIAGAVVVAVLILFWAAQAVNLNKINQEVDAQDAVNAGLQGQIQELLPFQEKQDQLEVSETLVDTALAHEVSWSAALRDVQLIIPNDVSLTHLTGTISAPTGGVEGAVAGVPAVGETTGAQAGIIGDITFEGQSQGTLRLARWLARLVEVRGWVNSWLSSAQETGPRTRLYEFTTSVDLLPDAETARGQAGDQTTGTTVGVTP